MESQSSVCTVNTIKGKPLEMSKGKLDNMCFDAGIWSLKVKKTGKTSEVCLCLAPVQHINILLMCLSKFFTELNLLVFLKYHQTFQISFRLKEVLKLDFYYEWMLRSIFFLTLLLNNEREKCLLVHLGWNIRFSFCCPGSH